MKQAAPPVVRADTLFACSAFNTGTDNIAPLNNQTQ